MIPLRPYQQAVAEDINTAWALGYQNVMAVMPTGAGKTVLFSHIIGNAGVPSVAIAHRHELVAQISLALARNGIRHGLIAADTTVRGIVRLHMDEFGRSWYEPSATCKVASVDTLVRVPAGEPWLKRVGLWVCDECFPAGTLVDGRPIETLRVGDTVTAFNEETGGFEPRQVVRLFKNPMPKNMVRLVIGGHHVLHCTEGHPFYTRRGWVEAGNLTHDDIILTYADLHDVRGGVPLVQSPVLPVSEGRKDVLLEGLQRQIPQSAVIRNDGTDEPPVCVRSDENPESNAATGDSGSDVGVTQSCRTSTPRSRWKREESDRGGSDAGTPSSRTRVHGAVRGSDRSEACEQPHEVPNCVQTGLWQPSAEVGDRSGRVFTQRAVSPGAGREERRVPRWARVDRVEILEPGDSRRLAEDVGDDHVYNVEVDGLHTYIANGVVVHNCHHAALQNGEPNKWARAALAMPNARGLGVTATPIRADGLGLGRHADGIFDWMVEGPTMRELIDAGFLTEYEIFCPPNDLDLSAVAVTASGDYSPEPLRKAVHSSHIVGDAVSHYLKHCAGKRGITFCVDIEASVEQCQAYRAAGIPAEVISSKTDDLQRAAILRKFRSGEVLQLTNVDLVGEGFDLPALECVSMCRPTQSFSLYAQQFGRVLRLMDGKRVGTVLDHVGNVVRHRGPPDMPRTWTLDRREKRGSSKSVSDAVPMRVCPQCTRPYERSEPACPYCGHAPEPAGRSAPEQVDGDLTLLDRSVFERMWQAVDRGPRFPHGASMATVGRIKRDWFKKNEAQGELRDAMAQWGGVRRAAGDDDRRIQRRFFHTFGIDVLSAQALTASDAERLTERVRELLQRV